jgi:hypothetical protein
MEFTLYYRGKLSVNGGRNEKHRLRLHFSQQLHELWRQKADRPDLFFRALPDITKNGFPQQVGPLRFAALLMKGSVAELDITILRPEAPGAIISKGGDIGIASRPCSTAYEFLLSPTSCQMMSEPMTACICAC